MNVSYRELPDIPRVWLDFLAGAILPEPFNLSLLPARFDKLRGFRLLPDIAGLFISEEKWRSPRTIENYRRLQNGNSVAVVSTVHSGLLGGAAHQIFKCLTAIKASEELTKRSVPAVPVCCISAASVSEDSINLLDDEGELHGLSLIHPYSKNQISDFISRIETLGAFDPDIIEMLRDAYSPDATLSSGCARVLSGLMKEWGLVVLDSPTSAFDSIPESNPSEKTANLLASGASRKSIQTLLFQCSQLPVIACIVDPYDLQALSAALPLLDNLNLVQPIAWPASSATVMDPRSRKTLERYNLRMSDIFAGEIESINKIKSDLPDSERFAGLQLEVERTITELDSLATADNEFLKFKNACKEKIVYQVEKMQKGLEAAISRRQQAAIRQVHRACNLLAPNRRLQERELAGAYFPLRYSGAVIRAFYERLDGMAIEHQLIEMD
jgi:uncharacterized protein YllA (UPF0747 family)